MWNESQLAGVEADAEVDGSKAKIVLDGPTNDFRTTIEVPAHSDLFVRLSAGELSIEVGWPEDYSHVEASVWAGELSAAPFQVAKAASSDRSSGGATASTSYGRA